MKKINFIDSIRQPIITEKQLSYLNIIKLSLKYIKVLIKKIIKKNIEKLFKVNVIKINIINTKTKKK